MSLHKLRKKHSNLSYRHSACYVTSCNWRINKGFVLIISKGLCMSSAHTWSIKSKRLDMTVNSSSIISWLLNYSLFCSIFRLQTCKVLLENQDHLKVTIYYFKESNYIRLILKKISNASAILFLKSFWC